MPPELAQWIPPAVIVGVMLYLHRVTRQDMARMESRLREDMKRLEDRVARLEHSQAKLEGLLEGLREAITRRKRRLSATRCEFPEVRRKRRPSFGLYGPLPKRARVRYRPLSVVQPPPAERGGSGISQSGASGFVAPEVWTLVPPRCGRNSPERSTPSPQWIRSGALPLIDSRNGPSSGPPSSSRGR